LIFTFTSFTNGTFSNATLTALEHMEQVSPLACKEALENCEKQPMYMNAAISNNKLFFMLIQFKNKS
jgi:hypothetical protein